MSLLLSLLLATLASDTSTANLPKGTVIKLHLDQKVSSETASLADRVTFVVSEDVKFGSTVVIPKGSEAKGFVSTAIPRKVWGYPAIGVYVGSVRAPSGFIVPVQGTTERGGDNEAIISTDTEIVAATELPLPVDRLLAADDKETNDSPARQ